MFNEDGTGLGFDDDSITADYFQMWADMTEADVAPDPDEQSQIATLGIETLPIVTNEAATTLEWNTYPNKMWADMTEADVAPDPDEQSQIATLGIETLPIVTNEAATTLEWNTYPNKVAGTNDKLKLALMPGANENNAMWLKPGMFWSVSETSKVKEECAKFINWMINSEEANDIIMAERGVPIAMWLKPGMFWSVSETSKVKEECAKFINWMINSEEANDIIMAERGVPISSEIRDYMVNSGKMSTTQTEMFEYVDKVTEIAGECPSADPGGIAEINKAFNDAGNSVQYGQATAEEAAKTFRKQATEILERNNG